MITQKIGIALVAPGGYAVEPEAVTRGIALLESQGILVHNYYEHDKRHLRFGGTDEARLAQLNAAAADPDVQIVLALRGQYGMTRLMPHIDFDRMADSGKIFVGYSDITDFHMGLYARRGASSYAGPMLAGDFGAAEPVDFTLDNFWQCLKGPTHTVAGKGPGNPALDVAGTVWGGNLAMIVSLLGTPYFPQIDGGILFLEDIAEHPYRVERMLLQLMQAGVLARQRAIVLGDFSGYRLAPSDNGYNFDEMLAYLRATLPCPILTGLEFGHIQRRVTIPFGAQGRLVSADGAWKLTLSNYPTLQPA
ncbi:Murein tetrapeptide carboxypeptidase [Massilia sp. Bi118]|uniref:muramoyltetrapeptide carboxypeptidase n=1 Tax=Massilia sp. Bi118 TaxID=2822346 RepID=UPI001E084A25|nr:muramoyltetrapeptide carboxypeptidase [Massilia sp. Bi118]CAH0197995.1 Murein tetrapeptide carboxypeptidase [Massilia sp. Bi118]